MVVEEKRARRLDGSLMVYETIGSLGGRPKVDAVSRYVENVLQRLDFLDSTRLRTRLYVKWIAHASVLAMAMKEARAVSRSEKLRNAITMSVKLQQR